MALRIQRKNSWAFSCLPYSNSSPMAKKEFSSSPLEEGKTKKKDLLEHLKPLTFEVPEDSSRQDGAG